MLWLNNMPGKPGHVDFLRWAKLHVFKKKNPVITPGLPKTWNVGINQNPCKIAPVGRSRLHPCSAGNPPKGASNVKTVFGKNKKNR